MAAKKRKIPAGGKCKRVTIKTGKQAGTTRRMCWGANGKLTKAPARKARKRG